jgi:Zn-dependent protease
MNQQVVVMVFEFVVLIFAFSIHEAAHAWMAARLGDPTAMMLGRITLNPMKHIELWGSIVIPIIGIVSGGMLVGWAKPCPVTPRNFRRYKRDDILVSLAGITANLMVAVASLVILIVLKHTNADAALDIQMVMQQMVLPSAQSAAVLFPIILLLYVMVLVNLSLFIFNLIPVPPLDGSHVLRHFLPYNALKIYDSLGIYGFLVVFFILPLAIHVNIYGMLFLPARIVFEQVLSAA